MNLEYLKNVTTLTLNIEKCIGCYMCIEVCPREVFLKDNQKVKIIKKDSCIECGACSLNCPVNAINVKNGVGCAAAIYSSFFNGGNISCDCSKNNNCC